MLSRSSHQTVWWYLTIMIALPSAKTDTFFKWVDNSFKDIKDWIWYYRSASHTLSVHVKFCINHIKYDAHIRVRIQLHNSLRILKLVCTLVHLGPMYQNSWNFYLSLLGLVANHYDWRFQLTISPWDLVVVYGRLEEMWDVIYKVNIPIWIAQVDSTMFDRIIRVFTAM